MQPTATPSLALSKLPLNLATAHFLKARVVSPYRESCFPEMNPSQFLSLHQPYFDKLFSTAAAGFEQNRPNTQTHSH